MMRGYQIHPRNRHNQATDSQAGFSLIEIMVVMIILLIGIFALVRLFPQGFAGIMRTGDLSNASALAQQQIDIQKNQYSVAEAIVAVDPFAAIPNTPDLNTLPDDLNDYSTAVNGKDPYFWSNVNRIRRIIGETFRIPGPSTNSKSVYGAVYTLSLGPVENILTAGNPNTDGLQVYGAALERTEQSSVPTFARPDPTAVLRNESQYAIDYDNFMIAFAPRIKNAARAVAFRQYLLSYDYYTNNGGVIGQLYQPKSSVGPVTTIITVPDVDPPAPGYTLKPVWQHIFVNAGDPPGYVGMTLPPSFPQIAPGQPDPRYGFNHGSEDVSRQFRLVNATTVEGGGGQPVWSPADPYEYAWFSRQDSGNAINPGVLIFNPSGHDQVESTSSGTQPLLARVDYNTYDNHILHDDRSVPNQGPYTIQLSAPFLQLSGDVLDNQIAYNNYNAGLNPYNGIFRTSGTPTPDVLIYNIATGEQVGSWLNGAVPPGTGILTRDPVRDPNPVGQQSGTLTLNPDNVAAANLQGASLRIYYRSSKDWGVQVQKATAHYIQSLTPALQYNTFYVGGTQAGVGGATRIYFPRCDAGKTVVLSEYYVTGLLPAVQMPFRNEVYQLADDPATFDALNLPYLDVASQHPAGPMGTVTGFSATQTGRPVGDVLGVSLKAKVIWRNSNLRWRHVENDTILNQPPAR